MSTKAISTKVLSGCLNFLISMALGIFAVTLVGRALHGDYAAITLAIIELIVIVFSFWSDGKEIPTWLIKLYYIIGILWFIAAMVWGLFQLRLI